MALSSISDPSTNVLKSQNKPSSSGMSSEVLMRQLIRYKAFFAMRLTQLMRIWSRWSPRQQLARKNIRTPERCCSLVLLVLVKPCARVLWPTKPVFQWSMSQWYELLIVCRSSDCQGEINNKYIGQSERKLKDIFTLINRLGEVRGKRSVGPSSILFMDEIDSITGSKQRDSHVVQHSLYF